uniref:Olfactory receptor n=1 Tax=Leptobrachium leishanense TaxID=445787 RepID=A0A8C5Q3A1_9ANUR
MAWKNDTNTNEFILLGLSTDPRTQIFIFVVIFCMYCTILIGNSLIIIVTTTDNKLQTPMYFFLTNLSFLDIFYSSTTVPRMLRDILSSTKTISYAECVAQMYIALSLGEIECILLSVMAFDRYVAICHPLHYTTIISRPVCIRIACTTWLCGFLMSISSVKITFDIGFCGEKVINHFHCEVPELVALGCGNVKIIEFITFVLGIILLVIPVLFIFITYMRIIHAIQKITSSAGQKKAFSTCGSHIMVATLFYGSAMSTYLKPRSHASSNIDKLIAVFYTIVTPMLNPLIYTLRNKEVKTALKNIRIKKLFLQLG